ncbi:MAG: RNase AM [Gammaproteobacteria bacterium]|nr:MAG: RNase AM [Gammaproteobacteria bacterium]
MSPRYDLHSHSLRSDGTLTPAELVTRAHAQGVGVLALTDHDVTDGIAEAAAAASSLGLELIPGVEISVTWQQQTIHIVGLGIDPADQTLQAGLSGLREFRNKRAREIDRRLQRKRITGAYAGAAGLAQGAILSRTHFARFLVSQGYAGNMRQAFKRFLTRGKPGYVPGCWATLEQAVGWIHGAGGLAVIAHPARYRLSAGKLRKLLGAFKDCGGAAIEVISGSQRTEENNHLARLASEFGLLASVGSDFHGPDGYDAAGTSPMRQKGKPWTELGRLPPLPAVCTPVWQAW